MQRIIEVRDWDNWHGHLEKGCLGIQRVVSNYMIYPCGTCVCRRGSWHCTVKE